MSCKCGERARAAARRHPDWVMRGETWLNTATGEELADAEFDQPHIHIRFLPAYMRQRAVDVMSLLT